MSEIINSTMVLATLTFLWYRKGKLWNFYDTLLSKSIEQIKTNSIDSERWKQIALEQLNMLSAELFNSLFRFETEYLQDKILKNKYCLWIADSEENGHERVEYTDKEKYCKHTFKEIYLPDFRFCGFGLFLKAIKYKFLESKDKDPGYVKTKKTKP